jgi:N-acylneuraminate cytidylyltransferase
MMVVIPARGGSKGIPRKNVKLLAGKPLVAHSILQAKQTPGITRVIVSTDDPEIAAVSREWGADVVKRPPEISGNTASSESALLHTLDWLLTTEHYEPELVVFLQATSPIREPGDIQRGCETLERDGADSLFSACRVEGFTWRLAGGAATPVNYDPTRRPLRQDLKEEIWEENGSFYIFKPWVLRKFNSRLGGRIALHKMERTASFQIDEPGDFEFLEQLMRYRGGGAQEMEDKKQKTKSGGQWSRLKLLVLDFDGVMTDNRVQVTEDGTEAVLCNRGDGLGIERIKQSGIHVIVLSKEKNPVVAARCRKLGIECIQGCDEKLGVLIKKAEGRNLKPEEIGYVGNDINDLECMKWVGLPIAVADSVPEIRSVSKWITSKPGGHGAVREVCDHLLASKGGRQ